MLYCLYENTHTCLLKRESGTLGDGSSSSGTTFPFGGEWSELLVLLSDFLTVRSYKCVMTLEQHRAPVTKFRIIMVQHEREKVSFLATCKGGGSRAQVRFDGHARGGARPGGASALRERCGVPVRKKRAGLRSVDRPIPSRSSRGSTREAGGHPPSVRGGIQRVIAVWR